jgi:hypothetical protein
MLLGARAWAAVAIPGAIPIGYQGHPASDLYHQGRILHPEEADALYRQSNGKLDLSTLNPDPNSDLWANQYLSVLDPRADDLGLRENAPVQYVDDIASGPGRYRVSVSQPAAGGQLLARTLLFSRTAHDHLLLKNLLRKIGYQIPGIQYLKTLEIRFDTTLARDAFESQLWTQTLGNKERWVVRRTDSPPSVTVQDVLALDAEDQAYNLSLGFLTDSVAQNRRLLSSLVVPFSFLQLSESVNMLNWRHGRVVSNHVVFPLDLRCSAAASCTLSTTWEDARWIGRRMAHLSRADWEEIVAQAHFPEPVRALLVEKLVSRRNSLREILKLEGADLPFAADLDVLPDVRDGRLLKEWYPGYATHFSTQDPENPIDGANQRGFFLSRALGTLLENAASYIDQIPILNQDLNKKIGEHGDELQAKLLENYLKTGEMQHVPFGVWAVPTWGIGLIASREVVTGSYLGTDNLVQLADTIGFTLSVGAHIGFDGLSPVSVQAKEQAAILRDYTHIRPLKSIKAALREPYRNLMVPLVNGDVAKAIEQLAAPGFAKKPDEERQPVITAVVEALKKELAVGESLLITDSLLINAGIMAQGRPFQWAYVGASLEAGKAVINRIHFYRKDRDTIQVYDDFGDVNKLTLAFVAGLGFDVGGADLAKLPILRASFTRSQGATRTKFSTVSLDADLKSNPLIEETLLGLRQAVRGGSLERLQAARPPYLLRHRFNQNEFNFSFLFWSHMKRGSATWIDVTHPDGYSRRIFRKYDASTNGRSWEAMGSDGIAAIVKWAAKQDFGVGTSSSNPGFTFLGSAKNRVTQFEAIADPNGGSRENFAKSSRIYNGWKISKEKVLKIIKEMNKRYGFNFFLGTDIQDTRNFLLYNLHWDALYYQGAFDAVAGATPERLKALFIKEGRDCIDESLAASSAADICQDNADSAAGALKDLQKARAAGDVEKQGKAFLKLIRSAEDHLNHQGLDQLFGGERNYLIYAKLEGFREGSESGDAPIISSTLGEFGSASSLGPVAATIATTGMTEGEFLISWVLKRAL